MAVTHVMELLNFSSAASPDQSLFKKDLCETAPRKCQSGITFPCSPLFCSCLGVHGDSFWFHDCKRLVLLLFGWLLFCLVGSFLRQNERGVVKISLPRSSLDFAGRLGVKQRTVL